MIIQANAIVDASIALSTPALGNRQQPQPAEGLLQPCITSNQTSGTLRSDLCLYVWWNALGTQTLFCDNRLVVGDCAAVRYFCGAEDREPRTSGTALVYHNMNAAAVAFGAARVQHRERASPAKRE